jgi:hypothetical protein
VGQRSSARLSQPVALLVPGHVAHDPADRVDRLEAAEAVGLGYPAPLVGPGEPQLLDERMGHYLASSSRSSAAKTSAITRAIGATGKSSRIVAGSVSIALYGAPLPVWARKSVRTRTMGFLPKA